MYLMRRRQEKKIITTLMLLPEPVSWSPSSRSEAPLPSYGPPSAWRGWRSAWQGRRDIEAQLDTFGSNCRQNTGITGKNMIFHKYLSV